MANRYVRSTDGNNADNASTWALAVADLATVAGLDAAGDTIYVSQVHAESTGGSTCPFSGTAANPTKIICADDGATPPTAVSTAGTVTSTTGGSISFSGFFSMFGLAFNSGSGANNTNISLGTTTNGRTYFENCDFKIVSTGSTGAILLSAAGSFSKLKNCRVRFANAGQSVRTSGAARMDIDGLTLMSGGTSPTALFGASITTSRSAITASRVDLTDASAGVHIFTAGGHALNIIRNSRLPASWSGSLVTGTLVVHERHEMYNCDSADTNYRLWIQDYTGSVVSETTVVRSGGASDGATAISWKMTSTANAVYPHLTLSPCEIVTWNETVGSAITATIEIVTDNVTLTDGECWVEVTYLGTSGTPLGASVNDAKADVLATAANQTTSTETWTTTGLTTPVKQKLSVTFTPQEKGFIHAVVRLAKASTIVYVDPKLVIT